MIHTIFVVLIPLILTILLELFIWYFVAKRICNYTYFWLLIIAVNLATNPLLNFILFIFDPLRFSLVLEMVLEVLVVFVEAGIFYLVYRKDFSKLLLISLILNAFSYIVGLILVHFNFI